MMGWSFARRSQIGGHSVPGLQMVSAGMRLVERAKPGVLHASLKACNDYANGEAAVAAVKCPVLVVLGERDMMTPAKVGRRLAERLSDARVVVLPKVGHMMMVEAPEALLEALDGAI
jgi:pimeloyl-ACP methyl ester carboxylesterase